MSVAPRSRIAATVAGTTPAASPGRPECAAPITPATGSASRTGTQSAARTISTTSGRVVTTAVGVGTLPLPERAVLRRVDDVHDRAVHLVQVGDGRTRREVGQHLAQVGGGRLGVVTALEGQVERVEGDGTDPAVPVREGQVDGAARAAMGVHPVGYLRKSGTSRSSSSNCTCRGWRGGWAGDSDFWAPTGTGWG